MPGSPGVSAFPALGLDAGPDAEDGRGSEAGEEGLACTTATEPSRPRQRRTRVPRPGGARHGAWGQRDGDRAPEHVPDTAPDGPWLAGARRASICRPQRAAAVRRPGSWHRQSPFMSWKLETCFLPKAPGEDGWRCVGLATSAATGCQSRPPPARPGHGCSQAWLLPHSRGKACGLRAGLPHVHCRQKVASRGWGTGSPGGWASRRAAPEPGGEAGCAKVGTDMANSSHPLGAPCTS